MKHRALSMLLALVMVVSLLPVAAIAGNAGENTGAEVNKRKPLKCGVMNRLAMDSQCLSANIGEKCASGVMIPTVHADWKKRTKPICRLMALWSKTLRVR